MFSSLGFQSSGAAEMIACSAPNSASQTGIPNSWIRVKVMFSRLSYHSPGQKVTLNGGLGRPLNAGYKIISICPDSQFWDLDNMFAAVVFFQPWLSKSKTSSLKKWGGFGWKNTLIVLFVVIFRFGWLTWGGLKEEGSLVGLVTVWADHTHFYSWLFRNYESTHPICCRKAH